LVREETVRLEESSCTDAISCRRRPIRKFIRTKIFAQVLRWHDPSQAAVAPSRESRRAGQLRQARAQAARENSHRFLVPPFSRLRLSNREFQQQAVIFRIGKALDFLDSAGNCSALAQLPYSGNGAIDQRGADGTLPHSKHLVGTKAVVAQHETRRSARRVIRRRRMPCCTE